MRLGDFTADCHALRDGSEAGAGSHARLHAKSIHRTGPREKPMLVLSPWVRSLSLIEAGGHSSPFEAAFGPRGPERMMPKSNLGLEVHMFERFSTIACLLRAQSDGAFQMTQLLLQTCLHYLCLLTA
jgi:hypothetical protein